MANVLARRFLIRNVQKIREYSNLVAYPCTNIFLSKLSNQYVSHFKSRCDIKVTLLLSPKYVDFIYYSTTPQNEEKGCDDKKVELIKLSLFQKFKIMYRDYWYVLVPVHLLTSAVWFGTFYYMAKSGIDIIKLLEWLHVSEKFINPLRDSSMGYYAISYALYKIATPARYTVTLGGTTISINYLKKWGYIKPVPSKERMKEIIQEKKDTLAKSVRDAKEGINESKANLIETVRETKVGIIEKKHNLMGTFHEAKEEILEKKDHIIEDAKKKLKKHKRRIQKRAEMKKDK